VTRGFHLPIATLLFCLAAPDAAGQRVAADSGEQLVRDFVADVATLRGRFEQSLFSAEGEIVERSSGQLEIERPGKFRWSYDEPYEQQLVADGLNIWSYDVDLAQVTVKAQEEALANTPALLLGGDQDALLHFRFDDSVAEQGMTWVRMVPVDAASGFKRMELGFLGGQLSRMVFYDSLEQTTSVTLSDVVVNESFEAGHFVFDLPPDADLVGVPAVNAQPAP
jgi:outer membrane lipoprotein carrier protein